MPSPWSSAAAEFAATVAALNARALHRAGLSTEEEAGAMHEALATLENAATTPDQTGIVHSIRKLLPPAPTHG